MSNFLADSSRNAKITCFDCYNSCLNMHTHNAMNIYPAYVIYINIDKTE